MANSRPGLTRGAVALRDRMNERGLTLSVVASLISAGGDGTVHDHLSGRRFPREFLAAYRDRLGIPVDWWLEAVEDSRGAAA